MRICPHCKIKVGGSFKECPLCQSHLQGDPSPNRWPSAASLQQRSLALKLMQFLLLAGCVICTALDFLILKSPHFHWSVIVLVWSTVFLWLFMRFFYNHHSIPRVLFQTMIVASALAVWTEYYIDYRGVCVDYIVPLFYSGILVLNFIFSFVDAGFTENALVYILLNILVGVIPYIAMFLHRGETPVTWTICLITSVITFLGLLIFKGRTLWTELQKRLHL
ncbi:MAG: DUF6320 domain-containing protein [Candidatus Gastranaerophilales bacterium]|nr:DUF6320 domain-containing protein [Candidatus Gastranaerophilales bacterium]